MLRMSEEGRVTDPPSVTLNEKPCKIRWLHWHGKITAIADFSNKSGRFFQKIPLSGINDRFKGDSRINNMLEKHPCTRGDFIGPACDSLLEGCRYG